MLRALSRTPAAPALRSQLLTRSLAQQRFAGTLVLADHNGTTLNAAVRNTVTAAGKLGGDVTALVTGGDDAIVKAVSSIAGIKKVLVVKGDFKGQLAESVTPVVLAAHEKYSFDNIIAPSSAMGKNVLPRVAAKLNMGMLSDVLAVESADTFVRPMYAGNAIAKVKSSDKVKIMTVRGTSFDEAAAEGGSAEVEEMDAAAAQEQSKFENQELTESDRPQLDDANIVVSGGRALGSEEKFQMIWDLADKMKAATGATRAAVDAGYAPNNIQVGQTGKIVAPDLYIAIGVSGAIQHLAGMKDSKIIACINKDPEAPIFQVSDYGLEEDLFKAVPEMMSKL